MTGKAFILAALAAGAALGQSSMQNVTYRPQPRVIIPHVEAPQIIVSEGGEVAANPERGLRYTDFILCAVDQSRSDTNEVLFQFSTLDSQAQSPAVCFYQRTGADWPQSIKRRAGNTYTVTNWTYTPVTTYHGYITNWQAVISDTNCPNYFYDVEGTWTNVQSLSVISGPVDSARFAAPFFLLSEAGNNGWLYARTNGGTTWAAYTFNTFQEPDLDGLSRWKYQPLLYSHSTNFARAGMVVQQKTNAWTSTVTTNATYEIFSYTVLSIGSTSSNEAAAIEVYPVRQPSNSKWMRPANPDVKWMAMLSNGSNFYSTAAGDPVWFNCWVEWVDKIPTNGVW